MHMARAASLRKADLESLLAELGDQSAPEGILRLIQRRLGRQLRFIPAGCAAKVRPGSGSRLQVRFGDMVLGWLDIGAAPLSPADQGLLNTACRLLAACVWERDTLQTLWRTLLDGREVETSRLASMFASKNWPSGAAIAVIAYRAGPGKGLPAAEAPEGVDWVECSDTVLGSGRAGKLLFRKGPLAALLVPVDKAYSGQSEVMAGLAADMRARIWQGTAATVSAGVGGVAHAFSHLPGTWARALEVLRWGDAVFGPGKVNDASALGLVGILMDHVPHGALAAYASKRLGPVRAYDAANSADLYHTLAVFLESEGSAIAASQRLFIHYNTLRHRLHRLEELLGVDLNSLPVQLDLWASIQIEKLKPGEGIRFTVTTG